MQLSAATPEIEISLCASHEVLHGNKSEFIECYVVLLPLADHDVDGSRRGIIHHRVDLTYWSFVATQVIFTEGDPSKSRLQCHRMTMVI
jgi:hypothetical protein